jgi:hypothetical protein
MLLVGSIYAILAWSHRAPIVYADEPGFLGNARWLTGGPHWWMDSAGSLRIGYPLLIAPVFALVGNPASIYRIVLLINCVMVASMAGVLFLLVRRVVGASRSAALAASAIACAYPALSVQSGIAWAEVTSMLGVAVFVLTAWRLLQRPSQSTMLSNAAIAVFLSLVHNRFLAIPFLCLATLAAIAVTRRDLRLPALLTVAAVTVGWLLGEGLQAAVQRSRWDSATAHSGAFSVHAVLQSIPIDLFRAVTGQVWYLLVGTAGLVLLGLAALIRGFLLQPRDSGSPSCQRPLSGPLMLSYVLLALSSVVAISSVFAAAGYTQLPSAPRLDQIAYGRYNDAVVPTLVALALGALLVGLPRRGNTKLLAISALATFAAGSLLVALRPHVTMLPSVNPAKVPSIFPWIANGRGHLYSQSSVVWVTIVATGVIAVLALLVSTRPRLACAGVLCIFAAVAAMDVSAIAPTERLVAQGIPLYERLHNLDPGIVAYDLDDKTGFGYFGLPFWLNQSHFIGFYASSRSWPRAQLFVGPAVWPQAKVRGLRLLDVDPVSKQGMWLP